jgi:protein-S-isoprenylcysteine O-methyltransferase Ste14
MLPVFILLTLFVVGLLVIEFWYIGRGESTISARLQRANAAMGPQMVAGIFYLLGVLSGWFIAHFTSPPPV